MDLTIPPMNEALQRQVSAAVHGLPLGATDQQVADINPGFAARRALARLLAANRVLRDGFIRLKRWDRRQERAHVIGAARTRLGCKRDLARAFAHIHARNAEAERLETQSAADAAQERAEALIAWWGSAGPAIAYVRRKLDQNAKQMATADDAAAHVIQQESNELSDALEALRAMQKQAA